MLGKSKPTNKNKNSNEEKDVESTGYKDQNVNIDIMLDNLIENYDLDGDKVLLNSADVQIKHSTVMCNKYHSS